MSVPTQDMSCFSKSNLGGPSRNCYKVRETPENRGDVFLSSKKLLLPNRSIREKGQEDFLGEVMEAKATEI